MVNGQKIVANPRRGIHLRAWVLLAFVVASGLLLLVPRLSRDVAAEPECAPHIRRDGIVYRGDSYVHELTGETVGNVEVSVCDDSGPESQGAYFPSNPERLGAWSVGDAPIDKIVAVKEGNGLITIYIAVDLSKSEKQHVLNAIEP